MADDIRQGGLRTIFSVFLGLMLAAFVGVGAYTFHPPPTAMLDQMNALGRQEETIRANRPDEQLTVEDRARLQEVRDERSRLQDAQSDAYRRWGRSTSIVVIGLATLAMAFSLVRADELPVLSNGLLVGGVFTMLYGIGWSITRDQSIARFVVITIALALTLVLGYLRFVRRGRSEAAAAVVGDGAGAAAHLEHRVRELERKLEDAARAFQARP